MHTPSDREARSSMGGWWHWYGSGEPGERIFQVYESTDNRADADTRHAVYSRMLELCGLDDGDPFGDFATFSGGEDTHLDQLRRRGFSEPEIHARGYASHRREGRRDIAATLVEEFGEDTIRDHLPGIFWSKRGNTGDERPDLAGAAGVFVPYRDVQGRISGLQIRHDQQDKGRGIYRWFSSAEQEGGCGSGAPIHVSRPFGKEAKPDVGVVTEGALKGDRVSTAYGVTTIAMAGVSGRTGVVAAFRELGVSTVVVALDMDAEKTPEVMRARDDLATELAAAGFNVGLAEWDPAYKGVDDAINAGVTWTVRHYPLKRRAGQMEQLPPEAVPMPELRPVRPLEQVRFVTRNVIDQIFRRGEPGQYIISSQTGVGKTRSTAEVAADLIRSGKMPTKERKAGKGPRPSRTVYLAPTKELVDEFVAATGGLAMIVEGRNPDAGHAWGCHRPDAIAIVGQNRHNPAVDVCLSCKDEYQGIYGSKWSCNYLALKKVSEDHALIAAPIASYFNGSSELRNFDNIIVDEQILTALTETQTLTSDHIDQWRQRMNMLNAARFTVNGVDVDGPTRYGIDDPFRRFVDLLALIVAQSGDVGREWTPALPLLLAHDPDLGILLKDIAQATKETELERGRFSFEEPRGIGTDHEMIPLRLCQDLIAAIITELERPEGADTRIWLTAEGLRLFIVRDHLVDILRARTVIMLDATPNPLLRILFPELKEITYDAPAPMVVTQITDTIATRTQLAGEHNRRRDRIADVLEAVTKDATSPAIFTFKGLDPNVSGDGPKLWVTNPSAAYGHFDCETRGVNRFSDADLVAIIGRYSAPLNELRATVQGVRFATIPPKPVVETRDEQGRVLKMRPYQWRADDGTGLGRWSSADEDPDVDRLVRWSESSTVIQAIGRGRAVLRPESAPLQVYLFTNNPIDGLPVDRLVSLAELGAPEPERQTPPGFYSARDERNASAESECRTRVVDALAAIRESGETVTVSAVARRADVARGTIYRNATLIALIEQAIKGTNKSVTVPVSSSPGYVNSLTPQDETPPMTDISPVRPALVAADKARSREESHRTLTDLAARLAPIAAARGKPAVPKPGRSDISRTVIPLREVAS